MPSNRKSRSPTPRRPPADPSRAAPANITAVIGASQTGKGMYCKERLSVPHFGITFIWSWLEGTDHYADLLGAPKAANIPALCDAVEGGARCVVYVPDKSSTARLSDREHVARQFELFCRLVAESQNARALVEELKHVTSPSWSPPYWSALSTAGAHDHLELLGSAQRPSMIDKDFIANCTQVRCYRLMYEEDARTLGRILRVPFEAIMDLPDLHYFHRVIRDRVTASGVQAVVGGVSIDT